MPAKGLPHYGVALSVDVQLTGNVDDRAVVAITQHFAYLRIGPASGTQDRDDDRAGFHQLGAAPVPDDLAVRYAEVLGNAVQQVPGHT